MRAATTMARVGSLLMAFLAIAVLMGLIGAGLMLPLVGATGTAAREGVGMFEKLPGDLEQNPLAQQSRIEAVDGSLIATPARENRIIVPLEQVAPVMRQAQVAIEDERFYEHGGLDARALSRAIVSNATSESTQGGSTLTQQYVKMILKEEALRQGDAEALRQLDARAGMDGYVRKLRELKYAVTLEQRLTKDEILEGYLNLAYYGDQVYGVEAAARHYFGVRAKDLSLVQAATLAGVVRAPGITDPVQNPEAAVERRNVVLDKMYEQDMIDEEQWRKARETELELDIRNSQRSCMNSNHPYFCDYVTEWLLQNPALGATREERETLLTTGGLTIRTTLDPKLSNLVREVTRDYTPGGNEYKLASAAAIVQPGTGHVLAFGQSSKYNIQESSDRFSETAVNWSVDHKYGGSSGFQIGSVAKAFTIVEALKKGVPIEGNLTVRPPGQVDETGVWLNNPEEPARPAPGSSTHPAGIFFPEDFQSGCTFANEYWSVRNAEDANHERVISLRKATGLSVNTAFATLASQVGTCDIRDTMADMGLLGADGEPYGQFPTDYVLGSDEASPLTVAASYATIAAGGMYCPPVPVTKITDAQGDEIPLDLPGCEQVVEPDVAAGAAELMSEVLEISGSGWRGMLEGERPAAGKTGTADESKHTWFAGFTPQLSTAVWIGSPGEKYQGDLKDITIGGRFVEGWLYGSKLAAPMWKQIMDAALEGQPVESFDPPSDKVRYGEDQQVPTVQGMTVEDAIRALGEAGFAAEEVRISSGSPVGTVVYSQPGPGSRLRTGSTVKLMVSNGFNAPSRRPEPPSRGIDPGTEPPGDDGGGGDDSGNEGPGNSGGNGPGSGGPGNGNGPGDGSDNPGTDPPADEEED